ncbi:MAG: PLP-dependent aminotransferase family protein [Chlorobiales bacterium]|nr:PLP-dependent aminotransferase family protein [Chlorobiales bacterium]
MSLLIRIDPRSSRPVFGQIMDRIRELVDSGALEPGARLPSTRSLADRLEVNRSTVYRAYQELWSLGYLESRPGSYSTIRKRTRVLSRDDRPREGLIDWSVRTRPGLSPLQRAYELEAAFMARAAGPEIINFIPLSPDSRLFPLDDFRRSMNQALTRKGPQLLQYGSPLGYEPLREFIARRMRLHSVSVSAPEIMITTGAQNALHLLIGLLARPGAGVALESPTYSRALDIFRLGDLDLLEVPLTGEGMDLEVLERILRRESPAFVYTIPTFHNPTGVTTGQVHREKLLGLCQKYRTPLVEDGFEEEMKYFGRTVLPIKSMDLDRVVIYLGTFSKVLFPGLRIGWIAADQALIQSLIPLQRTTILSGNILDQAALAGFCRSGGYELHIRRIHRVYRRRMQAALGALESFLNRKRIRWTRPQGGYTIYLRLRGLKLTEEELVDHLFGHGVAVLPGSFHFPGPPPDLSFRLSIAHLDRAAIRKGVDRLSKGLEELFRKQEGKS